MREDRVRVVRPALEFLLQDERGMGSVLVEDAVSLGSVDLSDYVQSVSAMERADPIEVTRFGDDEPRFIPGLRRTSVELRLVGAPVDLLAPVEASRAPVRLRLGRERGYWSADVLISNITVSSMKGELTETLVAGDVTGPVTGWDLASGPKTPRPASEPRRLELTAVRRVRLRE